jgi:hypothetical protein
MRTLTEARVPKLGRRRSWHALPGVVTVIMIGACGSSQPSPADGDSSPGTVASSVPDPLANPTVEGKFVVADDGRELAVICWGEGSPTVVLEAGHPSAGIQQFGTYGRAFVGELVGHTRVCAYDRAGNGRSDPAPDEPRDADDVVNDLHALLTTASIEGPYVLVGASFGGMIVTYYAARFPDDVAAVVLLDVPAPSATLSLAEAPELAWDHPTNPEHVNVVPEFENRFARKRLPFEAPLTVITASEGQSSVEDQSIWLELSPQTTQVGLQGGHNIYEDDPERVAAEVIKLLEAAPP